MDTLQRCTKTLLHEKGGRNVRETIKHAAAGVRRQIFFSIFIIILALLPILTLQRVEGRLFAPMAWTLVFAIAGSLLYSLTLAPVLSTYLLGPKTRESHHFFWRASEAVYVFVVDVALRFKWVSAALFVAAVGAMGYVFFPKGTEFLPELDEGCVWVRVFCPREFFWPKPDNIPRFCVGKYPNSTWCGGY